MKKNKKPVRGLKDMIFSKFTSGRVKGVRKRKKTLLMEYKLQNKSNRFVDRRIGESDRCMTTEDRIMARFVAQRVKAHNKKKIFNLEPDEHTLTHHGRTLQDIEKYDNPHSDTDDEDDGKLGAEFIEEAHFGGDLFKKVTNDNQRSTVDNLIEEFKKRKAERQQVKEDTQTLTSKLDDELKELLPLFNHSAPVDDKSEVNAKVAKGSYDVLVRELRFEPVGKPSSKLLNDEQLKTNEKQRLLKMELERSERMKRHDELAETTEKCVSQEFLSADALEDGLDLDVFDDERSAEESSDDDANDDHSDFESGKNSDYDEADGNENQSSQESNRRLKSPEIPTDLASLKKILLNRDVSEKMLIIEKIFNDLEIHRGISNKERLIKFFHLLLDYVDFLFTIPVAEDSWNMVDQLSSILFKLVQVDGDAAGQIVFQKLHEKYNIFSSHDKADPSPDMLIFLKLIPLLFPPSDYHHPVSTPAVLFLSQILFKNPCGTLQQIAKGLFVCNTVLEYVHLSHRFNPEVINFLRNVLYTAVIDFEDVYPPVRVNHKILVVSDESSEDETGIANARLPCSFITNGIPEEKRFKLMIIRMTVQLLTAFCELYKNLSACYAVWMPVEKLLNRLPRNLYPLCIRNAIETLLKQIESVAEQSLVYLVAEKKRPKALRLYEPNIRPIIEGRSFRTISQTKLEKEKLTRQYKREMKGALKEIRKDKNFLARVKLSEAARRDTVRKEKVKQIFGWGQSQQSEIKQMERKNRFKRK